MAIDSEDKKKVTITLSETEHRKLQKIMKIEGFSRGTDFFRHVVHKTYSDILEQEKQGVNTDDN